MKTEKNSDSKNSSTTPPEKEPVVFNPAHIYYSTEGGCYYIDTGVIFRSYSRKPPVIAGITRFLKASGVYSDDIKPLLDEHIDTIEIDRAVDWQGKLAGAKRGIKEYRGRRFLITEGPNVPVSKPGQFPYISSIIRQAFPDEDSRLAFCAWLRDGVRAINTGIHQPAPMVVLAGKRKSGKSLLAFITTQLFGGRSSNPMTAWSGSLPWNDNLLAAELLLIDDAAASTDPRARKAFGSRFKESIYAANVEINTRRQTSISMRPVWRVMVCCNETPENLSVIPPLEDGIEDKIMLLKVSTVTPPMPACTPEERDDFAAALTAELPAFMHFLENLKLPEHLIDSRSGVIALKDPELLDAVTDISPEKRLENLLHLSITQDFMGLDVGESRWMTAVEVQGKLQDRDTPTSYQASSLLKFDANAGRYLASLVKSDSPFVTASKITNGIRRYQITRPAE
ncbi:hypothetical protein JO972_08465 [Verrucomicrobiaceae bacterium 5K15]|uniref:Uncharacterized protein n=1 Tax=Oceaniferula flava TaxID=2800421 RepID=A0AAE2SBB3_9BACT|nr:hypothetical protein [Oceaniferula flavus]MBK1854990.1 hypothetical protein [Oceaniferula flavus]MBM1136296.1 hypothetical protein [Oceaniferula flavus]